MRRAALGIAILLTASFVLGAKREETLDELKTRAETSNLEERAGVCVRIAEDQLKAVDKLFNEGKPEQARAALGDVITYSEKAGNAATQSGKKLKPTEIAVRKMSRKLRDIKRTVGFDEQAPVQEAIDHLERVRSDLLARMFGQGEK
jgi:NADP-dependent 3-hydroxy acid dehydrogenase YdfG